MKDSLKILHIVPAAFDYFDDIKNYAFGLADRMNAYSNIEAEVITLQYNMPTREERAAIKRVSPEHHYERAEAMEEAVEGFSGFDVIHIHVPFLGGAKDILRWKSENPKIPIVITFYRNVPTTDLISWYIKWYNSYYLPKIFAVADVVTVFPWSELNAIKIAHKSNTEADVLRLTDFGAGNPESVIEKGLKQEELTETFLKIYNNLI